jgi:hypothetical protein
MKAIITAVLLAALATSVNARDLSGPPLNWAEGVEAAVGTWCYVKTIITREEGRGLVTEMFVRDPKQPICFDVDFITITRRGDYTRVEVKEDATGVAVPAWETRCRVGRPTQYRCRLGTRPAYNNKTKFRVAFRPKRDVLVLSTSYLSEEQERK